MKPVKLKSMDWDFGKAKLTKSEIKMLSDLIASLIVSGKGEEFLKKLMDSQFKKDDNTCLNS